MPRSKGKADFDELTENINKLVSALTLQNQAQSTAAFNVSLQFENFDESKEPFTCYRERIENFFELRGVVQDSPIRARVLLNSIGSNYYQLITTLTAPEPPTSKSYTQLLDVLQNHLCPKPNPVVEQHRFLSTFQQENESAAQFAVKLRNFTSTCEFTCSNQHCGKSIADVFLRAQFIRGLKENSIREKLLLVPTKDLTFDSALQMARTLESSKIDNFEISATSKSTSESICQISRTKRQTNISKFHAKSSQRPSNSRTKPQVNFEELGIAGLCLKCGKNNHRAPNCQTDPSKLKCESCCKTGHVSKVCIMTLTKKQGKKDVYEIGSTSEEDVNNIIDIFGLGSSQAAFNPMKTTDRYYAKIKIGNKFQIFEVDSGAGITILPKSSFNILGMNDRIRPTNIQLRSYTKELFKPIGKATIPIEYNGISTTDEVYIIREDFTPLLGRAWIRKLKINLEELDKNQINTVKTTSVIDVDSILTPFEDIFKPEVGCIPNVQCSLKLRQNAVPRFLKHRTIPFALRNKVEEELESLERQGIITKVDTSDWGSPLVVIPKPDGNVRICVDYKPTLNQQLEDSHYPIPNIEEALHNIRDAKYFCTLDLYKAYLHVPVSPDSQILQTMSTHRGTYRVNRLSFGVKTAPGEFHRILGQITIGLKGVITYFDDFLVFGSTLEDCRTNLTACLERLRKFNLHVNKSKCRFFEPKIEYLGYVISNRGIEKSPTKVDAIIKAPQPTDAQDAKRFLGLIAYYSKFIPDVSTLTYPIRRLQQKNVKFEWSEECKEAFTKLKNEIASDRVLTPFNPKLPITIACDASPYGVAGVLSHSVKGIEKPVAFISRSLTTSEQNYSQLDREALSIYWTIKKFMIYLYGRPFTLVTDNKPLSRIFRHDSSLPAVTTARLLRYAAFLGEFTYEIKHRSSEFHKNVDYISRAPLEVTEGKPDSIDAVYIKTIQQITTGSNFSPNIAEATTDDHVLSKLKEDLLTGKTYNSEFSLQDGVIFRGNRVYIPSSMREDVLMELHKTHMGITKMKQLARRYCYWPNIDKDIEVIVKSCQSCSDNQKNPAKQPLHTWEEPTHNFQRVHIDYAGVFQGHHFFILVDAKSKWPEVVSQTKAPTSISTISILKGIFSRHGFPEVLVSDNASIFKSDEFSTFCKSCGITQLFIAPGHPATNGLAERYVQTFKHKLKAVENDKRPIQEKLYEILLRFRATPLACGKSPAELYLGRQLRIELDFLRPQNPLKNNAPQPGTIRKLMVGDRIQARVYQSSVPWKRGTVKKILGRLHYLIDLDEGYLIKRHINQLKLTEVQKTVQFNSGSEKSDHYEPSVVDDSQDLHSNIKMREDRSATRSRTTGTDSEAPVPVRRSERIRRRPQHLNH